MTDRTLAAAWGAVEAAAARLKQRTLRQLFDADADRFAKFSFALDDLLIDLSKEKIDEGAIAALLHLAEVRGVAARRDAMVAAEAVNETERREVLHMALRGGAGDRVVVDGADVMPEVTATLDRFLAFAEDVRGGGYALTGKPVTDVINIGIGGSDLGPAMAVRALRPDHDGPRVHFVSNVDGAHMADVLRDLDPATTMAIIASKTFSTQETMANAGAFIDWLKAAGITDTGAHLMAVSTNLEATAAFGIPPARVFGFWDWVGGRYSVWGAIGLSLAIAIGERDFRAFLAGAKAMDAHFRTAPLAENLPIVLALAGIWRRNGMGWPTVALIPYDQRLEFFAAYIQQLDMESNGKSTTLAGEAPRGATGPVIWGEPGTNSQHSFFQHLHQGTDTIPVDFIAAAEPREEMGDHHALLLANCLAQGRALAFGRTTDEAFAMMREAGVEEAEAKRLAPHRTFAGDRPSTTILHRRLDPFALGRLIALFEHKVFVQGVIWNVNSYDQWGVELGKALANELVPVMVKGGDAGGFDGSTTGLIGHLRALKG